jgi:Fungal chitosanase of glycosyl hydrolase group 75
MAPAYKPAGLTALMLGDIPALFESPFAKEITQPFEGKTFMCLLPGGALYFDSKLSLDLDGSPFWNQDIPDSQPQTSVKWEDGVDVDSNVYSYFVLPGNFWNVNGFREGDIGVVIFGMRVVFACFVDSGPQKSLGEGSINLHRELGFETLRNGKVNRKWGINNGVVTIVFPHSGKGKPVKKNWQPYASTNSECYRVGYPLFEKLKRDATAYTQLPDI